MNENIDKKIEFKAAIYGTEKELSVKNLFRSLLKTDR
jgi:hypothetical protein